MTRRNAIGRRANEVGMTLIELLVTVVIMGVAFEVIIGGLGVAILGSDVNRRQATADTVLRSSAEAVKGFAYKDSCSTARSDYQTALIQPAGFAVTVTQVSPASADATRFVACSDPPGPEVGLQLVSLSVKSTVRPTTETLEVVKRRP